MQEAIEIVKVVIMLLSLLCVLCGRSHAVPARIPRWLQPCAGSMPVDLTTQIDDEIFAAIPEVETLPPTTSSLYRNIADHSQETKESVLSLLDRYAIERFQDPGMVLTDLETFSSLITMPQQVALTAADITAIEDPLFVIFDTYHQLAATVVHLEIARQDESIHEPIGNYVTHIIRIEEDIYWKLCALRNILYRHGAHLPDHLIARVSNIRITDVTTRALRHTRDCLVLRDLRNILHRMERQFTTLSEQDGVL